MCYDLAAVVDMKRFGAIMIFAGAVLVSTHILAPAAPPPPPPEVIAADLAAIAQSRPAVNQVNAQVDRLRERLARPPEYPPPRRDPFRFGARRVPPRAGTANPAAPAAVIVEPVAPPGPALPHLIAIATSVVEGQLVRTAVLTNGDDVVVVKAGNVWRELNVRTIGIDTVELVDTATDRVFTVSLQ